MFIIAVAGKQFPVNPEFHHTARLLPYPEDMYSRLFRKTFRVDVERVLDDRNKAMLEQIRHAGSHLQTDGSSRPSAVCHTAPPCPTCRRASLPRICRANPGLSTVASFEFSETAGLETPCDGRGTAPAVADGVMTLDGRCPHSNLMPMLPQCRMPAYICWSSSLIDPDRPNCIDPDKPYGWRGSTADGPVFYLLAVDKGYSAEYTVTYGRAVCREKKPDRRSRASRSPGL